MLGLILVMVGVSVEQIKKLRAETGAGVMDVKKALDDTGGDLEASRSLLIERGSIRAVKKAQRPAADGRVFSYIHATGKIGALLTLFCETDFVARTDDFQKLGNEIVMQVAAMAPADVDDLLGQEYIRDSTKSVRGLLNEAISKLGENIRVGEFVRFDIHANGGESARGGANER